MILETKLLQDKCKDILFALDSRSIESISDYIELVLNENCFTINTTNKNYYVSTKFNVDLPNESFRAVVDAKLFLNLINKLSTKQVEFNIKDTYLQVKSSGTYKIPFIFETDKMVELPDIIIENELNNFEIDNNILQSICTYNSKEIAKATIASKINDCHYIDDKGCLTYNNGACINSFELASKVKFIIKDKIVKLFKLFEDDSVNFKFGCDSLSNGKLQTKIELSDTNTRLAAIITEDQSLFEWFPVDVLRSTANDLPYAMVVDKDNILAAVDRLRLFSGLDVKSTRLNFLIDKNTITISDLNNDNSEVINLDNTINNLESSYNCILYSNDLVLTLKNCYDKHLTINFGNHSVLAVNHGQIKNIISESTL